MKNMKNKWWHEYKSEVPAQEIGRWKIKRGKATPVKRDFPESETTPADEVHTALMYYDEYEWKTVMADSVIEIADGLPFVAKAYGRVLITGLGLGIVPHMLVEKPNVDEIVIIEKEPTVVEMIHDYLPDGDIEIIIDDAFCWTPDRKFDCAWHDIWTTIRSSMATEIEVLIERYEPFVEGVQMGWLYEPMKMLRAYQQDEADSFSYSPEEGADRHKKESEAMISFEDDRDRFKDKSTWDTTTKSKLGDHYGSAI